jgi:hypothetical protein
VDEGNGVSRARGGLSKKQIAAFDTVDGHALRNVCLSRRESSPSPLHDEWGLDGGRMITIIGHNARGAS